jgi:hypothetical protein
MGVSARDREPPDVGARRDGEQHVAKLVSHLGGHFSDDREPLAFVLDRTGHHWSGA